MSAWTELSQAIAAPTDRFQPTPLAGRTAKNVPAPGRNPWPDPRQVLANRTAELIQGTILTPENRQMLNRLGTMLDLTPFETALVIAVVQDQSRRGLPTKQAALAAYPTLELIGQPGHRRPGWSLKRIGRWIIGLTVVLMIELAIVAALL